MPRFEVFISGAGLARALEALNAAGIPTMGPTFTWIEGQSEPPRVGRLMLAVLDVKTAVEAKGRVSDTLRSEGACSIDRVAAFNPSDLTDGRSAFSFMGPPW